MGAYEKWSGDIKRQLRGVGETFLTDPRYVQAVREARDYKQPKGYSFEEDGAFTRLLVHADGSITVSLTVTVKVERP